MWQWTKARWLDDGLSLVDYGAGLKTRLVWALAGGKVEHVGRGTGESRTGSVYEQWYARRSRNVDGLRTVGRVARVAPQRTAALPDP